MSNVLGELFGDIADAIREKTGDTATMKPAEFPTKISGIADAPEILENLPIGLDFSGGNQTITAPDGTAVKSAIIQKPETLTPENVAEGVNIAGIVGALAAGGGSLPSGLYWMNDYDNVSLPNSYRNTWFMFNDELYAAARTTTNGDGTGRIYKFTNGAWTQILSGFECVYTFDSYRAIEFNGAVHFYGNDSQGHYIFNGTSVVRKNNISSSISPNAAFVQGGKFKAYSYGDGKVYVWDDASDAWTEEATIGAKYQYWAFFTIGDIVYAYYNKKFYRYENGTCVELFTTTNPVATSFRYTLHNGYIYTAGVTGSEGSKMVKIDVNNGTDTMVGRMPPFGITSGGLFSYQNALRFYGADGSVRASMVAYEVE